MAAPATSPQGRVCLGVIVGSKGLRGEVRIKSFTETPEGLAAYGPLATEDGARVFKVKVVGAAKGVVIARLAGIEDRTAADRLKGLKLYVDRARLPRPDAGTYYHADLVGLAVTVERPEGSERLGEVKAVLNYGGGDILEVARPGEAKGKTLLVPFTAAAVAAVDLGQGEVRIRPLPGLFDETSDDNDDEVTQDEGPTPGHGR
ncbi:MAG: ribosome maturation factor RimM [Rhodospirillaceae bacterium]|nr:ribosome maturation factor RimM [Rhodospirillaceae bacterium]